MFNGGNGQLPPWKEEAPEDSGGGGGRQRPTITLPPRTDTLFTGGFSPGPMTLLSSFFPEGDDCKSFSQLLAGAMASPAVAPSGVLDSPGFFAPSQVKILTFIYTNVFAFFYCFEDIDINNHNPIWFLRRYDEERY